VGSLFNNVHLKYLEGNVNIKLRYNLGKLVVMMGNGWNWLRIGVTGVEFSSSAVRILAMRFALLPFIFEPDESRDNSVGVATSCGWTAGVRFPAGATHLSLLHNTQTGSGTPTQPSFPGDIAA
jgi:hypothetical protein